MKKNIRVPFEFFLEVRVVVGEITYEFGNVLVSGFAKMTGSRIYGDVDKIDECVDQKGKYEVLGAMDQIQQAADEHAVQLINQLQRA